MNILEAVKNIENRLIEFRRHIHSNPELSFFEHSTCDYILDNLKKAGVECRRIVETGVLARVDGRNPSNRPIVLRADIDALPIEEHAEVAFKSKNCGVMHACGHDMHAAVLLTTALVLKGMRDKFDGTVLFLFQPGEELWPGGASKVIADGIFDEYDPLAFLSLHCSPEIPTGKIGVKTGTYMASCDEFEITVKGHGGHGALPHTVVDPVVASANIVLALQQIVSRNALATIPTVVSVGKFIADGATNIIPDSVFMEGTIRTMNEEWRDAIKKRVVEIAQNTARAYGAEADVVIKDAYPCVYNDPSIVEKVRNAATKIVDKDNIIELDIRMTAEDFGFFTHRYPSVLFRLGVGGHDGLSHNFPLHNSMFNPDEEALKYGAAIMAQFVIDNLSE